MTGRPPSSPLFLYTTLFRSGGAAERRGAHAERHFRATRVLVRGGGGDRKSTRLNSSHGSISYFFFFFNDRAPPELSPLPLHDALPIWWCCRAARSAR